MASYNKPNYGYNKVLKHYSGAKTRASIGRSKRWFFCAFAPLIVAQKPQPFARRLARRYAPQEL